MKTDCYKNLKRKNLKVTDTIVGEVVLGCVTKKKKPEKIIKINWLYIYIFFFIL